MEQIMLNTKSKAISTKSASVIYSVYCKRCSNILYVGQPGDAFYQSMLLNLSMIRTKKSDTIVEHFYSNGHSAQDFSVIGIENIYGDETYRKVKGPLWKKKLKTLFPDGLNRQIDLQ